MLLRKAGRAISKEIFLKAPAKINLYLEAVRKRPDGYHDIETIFQRVKLYDDIYLEEKESGITVDCKEIPQEENLVYKAALLLQAESCFSKGARIKLIKNIPLGSGLGGGSSDAASVLLGLNSMWGLGWDRDRLISIGKKLGADVPFFVSETGTALGSGRGDEISALENNLGGWVVLVTFPFCVSTKEVYEGLKIRLTKPPGDVKLLIDLLRSGRWEGLGLCLYNGLEEVTIRKHPEILSIKNRLIEEGATGALMSGSGPSVFGIFKEKGKAKEACEKIKGGYRVSLIEVG
ncbi:MAG: 4-(cytidine 5'-diphospho)-2-C-methyl-D-erythritol kinase [Candidatus Omnitrophica bacterium]|nr:4-(cytidine 5'-diphospho)-2-C-methyl-D-erythritol kinase [Candidatus Omnitrophota bacterium]